MMTEEAIECLRSAREGDREAAERLVEDNSGLIWSVARRYFGRGVDPDDLYQLGCVGFLKAIAGYDESYGTQFSTYAVPKISGEIADVLDVPDSERPDLNADFSWRVGRRPFDERDKLYIISQGGRLYVAELFM